MSETVKGDWSRVQNLKEFYSCPLWDNIEKRKAAEREKQSNDSKKQSDSKKPIKVTDTSLAKSD
jgi:hypothetical protein